MQLQNHCCRQIAELSKGIVEEFRESKKGKLQRTFVSGSDAANSKVNRTNNKRPNNDAESNEPPTKASKYGNFVSFVASSSNEDVPKKIEGFILPPKKVGKEPSSDFMGFCNNVIQNSRVEEPKIEESTGFKPNYQHHFDQHRKSNVENPFPQVHLELDYNFPLHNFIVVRLEYMPNENPCEILNRSAGFCKMPANWEYRGNNICFIKIAGEIVCEDTGGTKQEARDKAAAKALQILQKKCYTIKVKNKFLSDGTEVDMMDVEMNTKVGGKAEALGSNNMGHKLLSMMGWSGGGLGKSAGGVAEPITATTVFGREGLGNKGTGQHFKQKITKIVEEWIASNSPYDLVFTTGFDNEQRKEMHQVARRFNMKSKSFGKDDNRQLTISKKFDGVSLVKELLSRGGETEKYSLIPPGSL